MKIVNKSLMTLIHVFVLIKVLLLCSSTQAHIIINQMKAKSESVCECVTLSLLLFFSFFYYTSFNSLTLNSLFFYLKNCSLYMIAGWVGFISFAKR